MRSIASKSLAAALLLVGAMSIGGCGGSSHTKPLTRAELIARADAICRRILTEVDWPKAKAQTLRSVVDRLAALEEQAANELEQLTPPASMYDEYRTIVDGFKLTGPQFKQIAQEVQTLGPAAFPLLPLSNAQHDRGFSAKVARIEECVRP
jgi:hypothetical protein